jgi:hypothetical protein|nr:MAG TPA: hypothetical protein [Caudoviricetes sp.]DAS70788.1 MAG TPA: hypothetical protein [Caudoviricetes sp.]
MGTVYYYVAIFAAVLYLAVFSFYLIKDSNRQTRDMESGAESKLIPYISVIVCIGIVGSYLIKIAVLNQ